jgi:hypothetical protein
MVTYRVLLLSVLSVVFLAPVVLPVSPALEQTAQVQDTGEAAVPAQAQAAAAQPAVAVPPNEILLMLIRTSLIALNQANQTGNYSTLRDIGSPALQANNTAATLAVAFTKLREQNVDLSPVAVISPQLTEPAGITPQGLLNITGVFPTQPMQIRFQTVYQPVNGRWRLFGLSVDTIAPQPAPMAAAEPPAQPQPVKKKAKKIAPVAAATPAP